MREKALGARRLLLLAAEDGGEAAAPSSRSDSRAKVSLEVRNQEADYHCDYGGE